MPCPGEAGAPFEKMPMVMAALHPTGEVGLVVPQPDSIAAIATHTGIRITTRTLPLSAGEVQGEDAVDERPIEPSAGRCEVPFVHLSNPGGVPCSSYGCLS